MLLLQRRESKMLSKYSFDLIPISIPPFLRLLLADDKLEKQYRGLLPKYEIINKNLFKT